MGRMNDCRSFGLRGAGTKARGSTFWELYHISGCRVKFMADSSQVVRTVFVWRETVSRGKNEDIISYCWWSPKTARMSLGENLCQGSLEEFRHHSLVFSDTHIALTRVSLRDHREKTRYYREIEVSVLVCDNWWHRTVAYRATSHL